MKKIRTLHSPSANIIENVMWDRPDMRSDQVEIQTKLCGVCRSDIGSYARWEAMPYATPEFPDGPIGTFGHEGLGVVTKVGSLITKTKVGDIVSTWSDPAYADSYYATENQLTVVPEISHEFILQPVACAINILHKTENMAATMHGDCELLLLGTGFMSIIIGQYCKSNFIPLTVVGSSNKKIWDNLGYTLKTIDDIKPRKFKAIIDLSSKAENFHIITKELADLEAVICYASTPTTPITTNFFENCWDCHTIIMPSPRNSDFSDMMELTRDAIIAEEINPGIIWSKQYDRNDIDKVKQAFEDGKNRPKDYLRGYLKF